VYFGSLKASVKVYILLRRVVHQVGQQIDDVCWFIKICIRV
jgi:hypothetical protein